MYAAEKGTDTSIIGTLQNGEIVTVLDNSDVGWVKKSKQQVVWKVMWQENT